MTREEAIATIEAIKQFGIGKWIFDKEEIEAFDMAIEALSEYEELKAKWIEAEQRADYYDMDGDDEASIDLISRADAIVALTLQIPFILHNESPKRTAERIIGIVPSVSAERVGEWNKIRPANLYECSLTPMTSSTPLRVDSVTPMPPNCAEKSFLVSS